MSFPPVLRSVLLVFMCVQIVCVCVEIFFCVCVCRFVVCVCVFSCMHTDTVLWGDFDATLMLVRALVCCNVFWFLTAV